MVNSFKNKKQTIPLWPNYNVSNVGMGVTNSNDLKPYIIRSASTLVRLKHDVYKLYGVNMSVQIAFNNETDIEVAWLDFLPGFHSMVKDVILDSNPDMGEIDPNQETNLGFIF